MKITTYLTFFSLLSLTLIQAQISETSSPSIPIPDATESHITPGVVTNTITVGNNTGDLISDVTVYIDITHPWVGDLFIRLESPSGTSVQLLARPGTEPNDGPGFGCQEPDVTATFDDNGPDGAAEDSCLIFDGVDGTVTPYEPLSNFDGEAAGGIWTLTVEDYGVGDTGILNEWTLNISGPTLGSVDNALANFKVFPNPAQNSLNVRASNTIDEIQLYNLIGQEVLRDTPVANERTLDISKLQTGAYFLKVSVDGVQETTRIIKQ